MIGRLQSTLGSGKGGAYGEGRCVCVCVCVRACVLGCAIHFNQCLRLNLNPFLKAVFVSVAQHLLLSSSSSRPSRSVLG